MGWLAMGVGAGGLGALGCAASQRYTKRAVEARCATLAAERDAALEEARRANATSASKSEFLANMSHEIRTPLNSMVGTTELLLESAMNSHQKYQLRTVLDSAESLLRILGDILDFSKIESGKMALEQVPYDVHEVIGEVAEQLHARICESNRKEKLELIIDIDPALPRVVTGDSTRVRQILSNLLANAIKFTPQGHVLLQAAMSHGDDGAARMVFTVADTGIGIADDKRELIFDKFSQADGCSTTRQFGGAGLGLAICRQLVALMQGRMDVQSTYGKGSIFTVSLPLVAQQQAPAPACGDAHHGKRALIVDDSTLHAELLRCYLARLGIRSFISEDCQGAADTLRCAAESNLVFDYVFIEQRLNDGIGADLARSLRKEMPAQETSIIGMALVDDTHVIRAFARAGCDGVLHKPLFAARVEQLIDALSVYDNAFVDMPAFSMRRAQPEIEHYPDYHAFSVLLVEDNRVNRELALEMLAKFRIEAESAENGIDALNVAATKRFDLILMDCQMPEMDGFEASRQLRARMRGGEMADTPIIALTANAMKGDRERCMEAGMNDYLSKPLRLQDIRIMLGRWLDHVAREAA